MARQHPTVERGVWTPMLWTVAAVKRIHPSVVVRMDLSYTPEGVVGAMPHSLLGDHNDLHRYITTKMTSSSVYADSMCVTYNVTRVPPKLPNDSWVYPDDLARMAESVDGLSRFHPLQISEHNIGANEGLMLVIKQLQAQMAPGRYAVVVVDINVYMRLLKVRSCCVSVLVVTRNLLVAVHV
jgi:hypothetical protein